MSFRIAVFATKGSGSNEEERIHALLALLDTQLLPFDKQAKCKSFRALLRRVASSRPDLLVMEGTGLAGGAVCLLCRMLFGTRYVVSSGDAVGPFVAAHVRGLGLLFSLYERLLCRFAAGFIGWTPYLVGRALTFGTPRAVTAPGWAPNVRTPLALIEARRKVRSALGIPADALVVGIVGSLAWNRRAGYCYGYELIRAMHCVQRSDVVALIVGGGEGFEHLRQAAGSLLGSRILLTGPLDAEQAMDHLAAMDIGSLPQTVDGVGSFRFTTKLSEYLAVGLPVITSQIPMAYDLGTEWAWRLPGRRPWDAEYIAGMASLIDSVTTDEIARKRAATAKAAEWFDRDEQVSRVTQFVLDILQPSSILDGVTSKRSRCMETIDASSTVPMHKANAAVL